MNARRRERQERRAERRALRVENRRGNARRDARRERQQQRQDARTARTQARASSREVAYENEMNPNQFVSDLGTAAGGAAESYFENRADVLNAQNPNGNPKDWSVDLGGYNSGMSSTLPLLIGGGVLIYLMSKK